MLQVKLIMCLGVGKELPQPNTPNQLVNILYTIVLSVVACPEFQLSEEICSGDVWEEHVYVWRTCIYGGAYICLWMFWIKYIKDALHI